MTLALWLDSSLSTRLCLTLLHSLWQVAAVAVVLAILDRLLSRRSEALRYNLFVAGIVLCLSMIGVTFLFVETAPRLEQQGTTVVAVPPAELVHDFSRPPTVVSNSAKPTGVSKPATSNAVTNPFDPPVATRPSIRWDDFAPLVASSYALCVLAMLARLALGATRMNRVCASAEPITCGPLYDSLTRLARGYSLHVAPAIARSSQVLVPQVVGILKPTILLPMSACTGLSGEDLELVLAHELAHVRRHDLWVNFLQRVAESLLFFHPGLWYLSRRTSMLREYCCDEMVCRAMADRPRELRCQYASLLVRVAELTVSARPQRAAPLATFVSGNGSPSELRRRVAHLLGEHDLAPLRCSRGGVLMAAALLLTLFVLPAVWPTAANGTADELAVTRDAEAKKPGERTLISGQRVKLLAIGTNEEQPQRWWRADGTPLAGVPFQVGHASVSPSDNESARQLAFRIDPLPTGASFRYSVERTVGGSANGEVLWGQDETRPGYFSQVFCIERDQQHFDLRVGIAVGEWSNRASSKAAGGVSIGLADGNGIAISPAYSFAEPRFGEGTVVVASYDFSGQDVRVIAIDKAGKQHRSMGTVSRSSGKASLTEFKFRSLTTIDVDRFEIQTRPYEWLEFADLPAQSAAGRAAVVYVAARSDANAGAPLDGSDQASKSESTFELLVVDPNGQPVPNAVIEIRSDPRLPADPLRTGQFVRKTNYGMEVKADAAGRVILMRPRDPKRFSASVNMPGYGPYWASWDSTTVPRPIPASFTAELEAAWRVGGVVVDTSGDPIAGATVHPSIEFKKRPGDLDQLASGERIRTDAAGSWSFASVPVSESEVVVSIDHPNHMPERASLSRSDFGIDSVTEPTAKIVLQSGTMITGTVTDETGRPIAGALVRAQFHNDIRQATTAADGTYKLVGCEPRMARVVVSAKGRALDLQEVRVAEGMPPVNFQMKPGGHLRVRVIDEAGNPVPKARIFFQEWRGHVDYFEFDHVPGYADENGVWEWNEAPLDEIKADICRPNGMQLDSRPFQARAEEYVFQTPPALVVTGQVVDAETNEPIENFQAIPGLRWANNQNDPSIHWSRNDTFQSSDGRYQVSQNSEFAANFVRIEADGYEAAVSRDIKYDEGAVKIDFALKRGKDLAAAILTPGGEPAVGAKLALGIAGAQINLENGEIDDGSTYAARLEVDASGKFSFPPQDGAYQLVITHPTGLAHIDSTVGPIVSPIRLTPWARVEGTFRIGDKMAANVPITINAAGLESYGEGKPTIFTQHDATTDAEGRFVFERVIPGRARIGRNIILMVDDGATSVASSAMIKAEFPAGETTTINLGGSGRPVVGKLSPHEGFSGEILWNFAMIHVEADIEQPKIPEAPAEVQSDEARQSKWWQDWIASDAGQTWKTKWAEYEALRDSATVYRVSVAPDGTFRIEDMPPGAYVMSSSFDKHSAGSLNGYRFSVPLDDATLSGKPLELGTIVLAKD